MERSRLGNTSLEVSPLGFGASPLGDVFVRTDPAEGGRAVHWAIDQGINFFDVSPYYGQTLAEERLGAALAGRRHEVVLATKVGRYGADQFDFSRAGVCKGLEQSLRRLRTDYVDLLQVHDVEFASTVQIIEETLPALRELQKEGKARYVGITGYPLKMLVRIAKAAPVDTILSYCRYNLLFTDMDEVLMPIAVELGIGIINASPFAMGLLTAQGAPEWHPAPIKAQLAARRMKELCRLRGVDIATVALQFCLEHPKVSSTLAGMSTIAEVNANLKANAPLDPSFVEELRNVARAYELRPWVSGKSENQDEDLGGP